MLYWEKKPEAAAAPIFEFRVAEHSSATIKTMHAVHGFPKDQKRFTIGTINLRTASEASLERSPRWEFLLVLASGVISDFPLNPRPQSRNRVLGFWIRYWL